MGVHAWSLEAKLAALALRRHGAVMRQELLALGFTPKMIERRIASGLLAPVQPGVYLVGLGPTAPLAYEAAALLACRPRAVLAGQTAARLSKIPAPDGGPIHVIVVGRWRRPLQSVAVTTIRHLPAAELHWHEGLPITSPSLTLLDLAGVPGYRGLAGALNEARALEIVTDAELRATLRAHPKRRGAKALRSLLESERGPKVTRSEAERRALRVMRAHDIEPDASDVSIGPYRADFWFERERVAVEVDGFRYHGTPKRFVGDRRKIAYMAARGIQVFPLTWHDLGPGARRAMRDLEHTLAERRKR